MRTIPDVSDLQARCELGQRQLMDMKYLDAERTLASAEATAWAARDYDTLSRLYMPLQEARRQRRQRCGEGIMRLDLIAEGPNDVIDARHVVENYPHGQLLVAGWGTLEPALAIRKFQAEHGLFVDTFLAAVYPIENNDGTFGRHVVIAPHAMRLPPADSRPIERLLPSLPQRCIVLKASELPPGAHPGTANTYGYVMQLWERLHSPFLAAADSQTDPLQKMEAYRATIDVDYACELAHQKLSDVAKALAKSGD